MGHGGSIPHGLVRFTDEASRRGILNENHFGWGAGVGDLDDDGLPDVIQGNGYLDDCFETGTGKASENCPSYWYTHHKFAQSGPDIHTYADRWADLRGYCIFENERRRVFHNRGPEARPQFADVRDAVGLMSGENTRGVALVDLDGDGRLDVAMANQMGPPSLFLNRPDESRLNAWVAVDSRRRRQAVQPRGAGQPGDPHHAGRPASGAAEAGHHGARGPGRIAASTSAWGASPQAPPWRWRCSGAAPEDPPAAIPSSRDRCTVSSASHERGSPAPPLNPALGGQRRASSNTPRRAWSRSMERKSAAKFPSPKERWFLRWMISMKMGPMMFLVKIWQQVPFLVAVDEHLTAADLVAILGHLRHALEGLA